MKKMVRILAAAVVLAMVATPALATDFSLSGWYMASGIANNFVASNNYIGTLADNNPTETVVDQRFRLKLDSKVSEFLSFVFQTEVDMQWGDASYTTSRNEGGALGGDTVNLETKDAYIEVKIPDTTSAVQVGLQGFTDHQDYTFILSDVAGVNYTTKVGTADVTAGWFKLFDGINTGIADEVTLWALQAGTDFSEALKVGGDYYYYRNDGSQAYGTSFGTADIGDHTTGATWTANRSNMDLHYFTGHAKYVLNNLSFSGWISYNAGTVEDINNNAATPAVTSDLDVSGFASRLKVSADLSRFKLNLAGTYFSGDNDLTDGDAKFFVNPFLGETWAFGEDGFMIFTADRNWNSVGQHGFAMTDAAYAGYGLTSFILTGSFTPEQNQKLNLNGGIGYFASIEDKLAANDPRQDRAGTELGTEVFLRASYAFTDNFSMSLNGAYAFLGDFYEKNGGGTAVTTLTNNIDDPYEATLSAFLSF